MEKTNMGIRFAKTETQKEIVHFHPDVLKQQIIKSDQWMRHCPWIFDLEEEMAHHKVMSFEREYNIEDHVNHIFRTLSENSVPFCVFDVPFQEDFRHSKYPLDVLVGLYSIHHENLVVELYLSDIFMGKYTLVPFTIIPLDRYLLRFLFYGYGQNDEIQIRCTSQQEKESISIIGCLLENSVRKDMVIHSILPPNTHNQRFTLSDI